MKKIQLTKEQILMLQQSDKDIEAGKLISQEQLDERDFNWLKGGKFSAEQKAELDRRLYEYENGIGRTYTWKETVAMAKQKLRERKQ